MHLSRKNLFLTFFSGLLLTLGMPAIAPSIRLMFLVPFLIVSFYQKTFSVCLWYAFFCGLLLDLLSVQPPFGFYASNYTLGAAVIYPQKRHFFADHLSTLPIMTFLFSFTITFFQVIFLYILGTPLSIGMRWIVSDLFVMPLGDALFAFLYFILLPLSLQKKSRPRSI
ncbi:mreD [Neochlamydia sp. AcF95]|uniref:mreD n=1 Tax=Neochlamydia sp. AcF95 TaxID=2795734 RepID=UPI001BCA1E83|nr:mreD [Neochlamydia sp. AcF95]MBS4165914.1 Uncharacterized protein [Neochlamydia sp. AcF65]MBS4170558.1 Uncharacterized protein [Neochlamydia sp. AcF95]NGY96101.1 hypothetical protein [Neochlamydia sp. AcF84]